MESQQYVTHPCLSTNKQKQTKAYIAMFLNKYMTYGFPRIGEENAWLFARWRNRFAGYECESQTVELKSVF